MAHPPNPLDSFNPPPGASILDTDERIEYTIRVLPGSVPDAASYEFTFEDHTLGNALRHVISKNPDVEFCGYSIPHPAEPKMHLRIQTYDGIEAQKILEKGLEDLMSLCDIVLEKFEEAADDFAKNNPGEDVSMSDA